MKIVGRSLQKNVGRSLQKRCWNIYKMLSKNVGYTLMNVEKNVDIT
jgi:hypothetical protein